MLVAFEGPDDTGKSTAARELCDNRFKVTNIGFNQPKAPELAYAWMFRNAKKVRQLRATVAFDRVAWLTNMVYRLALGSYDWRGFPTNNDHTVFADKTVDLVICSYYASCVPTSESDHGYTAEQLRTLNSTYATIAKAAIQWHNGPYQELARWKSVTSVLVDTSGTGRTFKVYESTNAGHEGKLFTSLVTLAKEVCGD